MAKKATLKPNLPSNRNMFGREAVNRASRMGVGGLGSGRPGTKGVNKGLIPMKKPRVTRNG